MAAEAWRRQLSSPPLTFAMGCCWCGREFTEVAPFSEPGLLLTPPEAIVRSFEEDFCRHGPSPAAWSWDDAGRWSTEDFLLFRSALDAFLGSVWDCGGSSSSLEDEEAKNRRHLGTLASWGEHPSLGCKTAES